MSTLYPSPVSYLETSRLGPYDPDLFEYRRRVRWKRVW